MALGPGAARPQRRSLPRFHTDQGTAAPPVQAPKALPLLCLPKGTPDPLFPLDRSGNFGTTVPSSGLRGSRLRFASPPPPTPREQPVDATEHLLHGGHNTHPHLCTAPGFTCISRPHLAHLGHRLEMLPSAVGAYAHTLDLAFPPRGVAPRDPCPPLGFRRMCSSAQGSRSTLPP